MIAVPGPYSGTGSLASIPPDMQRPLRTREEVERIVLEEALSLYPGGATEEERARVAAAVRRGAEESPDAVEMLRRVSEQELAALRLVMRAELASSLRLRQEDP